jgi:putative intracellular protease/amidase
VQRFLHDKTAMAQLQHSMPIHQAAAEDYDAIFLAGGHGAMDDFSANGDLARLISSLYAAGGIISAVCHGTAGLLSAQKNDGSPLVKGLHVSSFTNEEERKTPKGAYLPFLLETRLREEGAIFESSVPFEACIVQDRRLVTGQNAASAQNVAENVVELLKILPQKQQNHNAA